MSSLRKLYYRLSPQMRFTVRKVAFFHTDVWQKIRRKRHKYEPPKGDIYIGSGDFIAQGKHHLALLKKYLDLKPNDSLLDVGSGIGRTAVALTEYMTKEGVYEGFDVVEKGVKWCIRKIHKDFPNFNFKYVPLNNDLYNTHSQAAANFTFPYPDQTFDKVFLFSVFTHMSVAEIKHYLKEIKRVLRPGGLCLSTFFLYTDNEMITENNQFLFPVDRGDYRLMNKTVTAANIALRNALLEQLVVETGFEMTKRIDGYWKEHVEKHQYNDFQDIVVLKAD